MSLACVTAGRVDPTLPDTDAMTLSGVTRRKRSGYDVIVTAGPLRIETFEGSRPEFGRTIANWEYLEHNNQNPKRFVWTADADLILGKAQRLVSEFLTQDTSGD